MPNRRGYLDTTPMKAAFWLSFFVALSWSPMCAAQDSVAQYVWGYDLGIMGSPTHYARLQQWSPSNVSSFSTVQLPSSVNAVSLAIYSAAAVVDGTKLYTWGRSDFAAKNTSATTVVGTSLVRDFAPSKIVSLGSGDTFSSMLLDNGDVYTWGTGDRASIGGAEKFPAMLGQPGAPLNSIALGMIDTTNLTLAAGERIVKLVTNSWNTLMLSSGGGVYVFGANEQGGLGQGSYYKNSTVNVASAIDLRNKPANLQIVDVSTASSTFLLLSDGSFLCCALNQYLCDGNAAAGMNMLTIPTRFLPPSPDVQFKRIMPYANTVFAWDQNGDLWFWGDPAGVPNTDTCDPLPSSQLSCRMQRMSASMLPPNSGRIVDIGTVDGGTVVALTERNDVFVVGCYPPAAGCTPTPNAWVNLDWPVPVGYIPHVSLSTNTGYLYVGGAKLRTPCTSPEPVNFFSTDHFICSNGVWTLFSSANLNSSQPYVVEGTTSIRGNLSIGASTTITFKPDLATINGGNALITVDGCLVLEPGVQLSLNLTQQQTIGSPKTYTFKQETVTVTLFEYEIGNDGNGTRGCAKPSTDSLILALHQAKTTSSCKTYKLGSPGVTEDGAKGKLTMVILINSSKCNLWWIILASVLGGVILIILFIALLATFNKNVKSKLRPFWVRSDPKLRPADAAEVH